MSSLYDSLMGKTVADKLSEANYKIRVLESELLKVNAKLEVAVDKNWDLEQNKKVIVHELNLGLEITPQKLSEFRRACENVLRSSMYRQQFTAEFEGMYSLFSSLAKNIMSNYKLNERKEIHGKDKLLKLIADRKYKFAGDRIGMLSKEQKNIISAKIRVLDWIKKEIENEKRS